jgi:hypothetical protein
VTIPEVSYMSEEENRFSREDMLKMLAEQIAAIDRLPNHAKFSFVTNADLGYALSIIYGLLSDDRSA